MPSFSRTTLRPDYEKLVGSSYELQTAENQRALADIQGQEGQLEQITGSLGNLVGSYNQAYGEARQANEQRYQQLLNISRQETQRRQGVFGEMLGVAGETTQQRATDIRAEGQRRESDIMQQLARQGMSGTTVGTSLRAGVDRDTQANLNRSADALQQTKLGILGQQAQSQRTGELGIIERRTDRFPSMNALTSAFSSVGQGFGSAGTAAALKSLSQLQQG